VSPESRPSTGAQPATFRDRLEAYRPDVAGVLADEDTPAYRYRQVYEHLMQHPTAPFSVATALPAALRDRLEPLGASSLTLARRREDADGTTKLLFEARDGLCLESVLMRYRRRVTLCVSSQIGCPLRCTFCATGAMGFRRDLSTAEIVDQVREATHLLAEEQGARLSNVVFMGMGEPLLNLDAVAPALRLLYDPDGLGLAQRALSISTIGLPTGIRRLAKEAPQVNLALSLHAPDDALRATIMPATRRHPLREVFKAVDDHFELTHRKLFVEYLMLAGVNDSVRQGHALADLMRGRVVTVNLTPWNTGCGDYEASPPEKVREFRDLLLARGVETTVRVAKGAAADAACGQLAARDERGRPAAPGRPQPAKPKAPPKSPPRTSGWTNRKPATPAKSSPGKKTPKGRGG
jgi:23S rRNA (adenine2503-C2)-methyltransferase